MPNSARQRGHRYEREAANFYSELFDEDIKTARYSSRELDDKGVDLDGTQKYGINMQLKHWQKQPNFRDELDAMPDDDNYNLVYHKQSYEGELVVMRREDWDEILEMLITEDIL